MRIILLGYVVRGPLGGVVWHHLQYSGILRRLGKGMNRSISSKIATITKLCCDPEYHLVLERTFIIRALIRSTDNHGMRTGRPLGGLRRTHQRLARTAGFFIPGTDAHGRPYFESFRREPDSGVDATRAASCIDRHRSCVHPSPSSGGSGTSGGRVGSYSIFYLCGELREAGLACFPTDGFPWLPTSQPVVLDRWRVTPGPIHGNYTTVMQWDSYPPVEHAGRSYGMKSVSFEPYWTLPGLVDARLELAVRSASTPRRYPPPATGVGIVRDLESDLGLMLDVPAVYLRFQSGVYHRQARLCSKRERLVQRA